LGLYTRGCHQPGKTIMIEFFLDHQEALEAAGLSE
jgi:hypothetical protein